MKKGSVHVRRDVRRDEGVQLALVDEGWEDEPYPLVDKLGPLVVLAARGVWSEESKSKFIFVENE